MQRPNQGSIEEPDLWPSNVDGATHSTELFKSVVLFKPHIDSAKQASVLIPCVANEENEV